jgi:hypothetical protein
MPDSNLLHDLAGCRGENVSTAALVHVLRRPELLRRFLRICGLGEVEAADAVLTRWHPGEDGVPDVRIATESAIVLVENKPWRQAQLTEAQPEGYYRRLAKSRVRTRALVFLHPAGGIRALRNAVRRCAKPKRVTLKFIAWEKVLTALSRTTRSNYIRALLEDLRRFVLNPEEDMKRLVDSMTRPSLSKAAARRFADRGRAIEALTIERHMREIHEALAARLKSIRGATQSALEWESEGGAISHFFGSMLHIRERGVAWYGYWPLAWALAEQSSPLWLQRTDSWQDTDALLAKRFGGGRFDQAGYSHLLIPLDASRTPSGQARVILQFLKSLASTAKRK